MTRLAIVIICVLAFWLDTTFGADEKAVFTGRTSPLQAMRALPGTFHIYLPGDVEVRPPKSVKLRLDGLEEKYQKAQAAGEIPPDLNAKEFKWLSIAMEPEKYLSLNLSDDVVRIRNARIRTGTGFAISREGILLTNRHVVEDQEKMPLLPENLEQLNPAFVTQLDKAFLDAIGPWTGERDLGMEVLSRILAWLGENCRASVKFDSVLVAVAFAEKKVTLPNGADAASRLFGMAVDQREPILVPAKVLARGGDKVSTDVAILKLEGDVLDALVCLPLAKPGRARTSDRILSLGFPGYRYDEAMMSLAELSMVSISSGLIHWMPNPNDSSLAHRVKASAKGLTELQQQLIAVTAVIRPGSSGGPLILEDGTAIGLNVAYRPNYESVWDRAKMFGKARPKALIPTPTPEGKPSLDLAVPIEVAHKMLAEQNITPNPGPTTALWREGMDLYDAGRFAEALNKFDLVASKQVVSPVISKPYEAKKNPIRVVSHYVQEMIDLCRQSLK